MTHRKIAFLGVCIALTHTLYAQNEGINLHPQFGIFGVANSYQGDMMPTVSDAVQRVYPGIQAGVRFQGKSPLGLEVMAGGGRIGMQYADGAKHTPVEDIINIPFVDATIFHVDARLLVSPFHRGVLRPYASAGIGTFVFNTFDKDGSALLDNIFSRPASESVFNGSVRSIPLTIGTQLQLTRGIALAVNYTYRMINSDLMDNIGSIGKVAGNDKLHQMQVGIYFSPQYARVQSPKRPTPPSFPEKPDTPLITSRRPKPAPAATDTASHNAFVSHHVARKSAKLPLSCDFATSTPLAESAITKRIFRYHTVKAGEVFADIVAQYCVSPDILRGINFLNDDELFVGMILRIPVWQPTTATPQKN